MPFYEYRQLSSTEQATLVAERMARGFPPHRTPHPNQGPGYYLLTAACYEHQAIIVPDVRRTTFQEQLLAAFDQPALMRCAWVILPNHYHLLIWLPSLTIVQPIFNALHGRMSRLWNLEDNVSGRKIWYHYSDRAIRNEGHFYRAVNYIHANPVKHGYVLRSRDWSWSSLTHYLDAVGMDWLEETWKRYSIEDFGKGWDDTTA